MSTTLGARWGTCISAALVLLTACGAGGSTTKDEVQQETRTVTPTTGNPTCPYGMEELKIDASALVDGTPTTYTAADGIFEVEVTADLDASTIDFTANYGVDQVIMKGGNGANVYSYDPEVLSDTGLVTQTNPNNGKPYGISHISFCYDWELEVSKTAETEVETTYTWEILKTGSASTVSVPANGVATGTVNYTITLTPTGVTSGWSVSGEITIVNPSPYPATITAVTDAISGLGDVDVDCGASFPITLAAGDTLVCTYGPEDLPNGDARTNTATVTTTGKVGGDTATAAIDFSGATAIATDECVTVDDTFAGGPQDVEVCVGDPLTLTYTRTFGPYTTCPTTPFPNTASFVTNDTATTGSESWSVTVTCPVVPPPPPECPPPPPPPCGWCPCPPPPPPPPPECPPPPPENGCTLTQGYWKTHSELGKAPYDPLWAEFEDDPFFQSGLTAPEVLWTPPKGNAYFILAHQYIAAWLNMEAGASAPAEVTAAFEAATSLFTASVGTTLPAGTRAQAITLAGILAAYNEGAIGPGHCD